MGVTLPELCEPFFQYVCRLNRSARKGARAEEGQVRGELAGLLSQMKADAASDLRLRAQYDRVELALIYFADFMIKESKLPFARRWKEMAHDRNKLAGDEEFFDLMEETISDTSDEASERLVIFYTCLGLGFTGFYMGQPEALRKKMMEISPRVRAYLADDREPRICPEAYEHTDTSDLIEPPGRSLVGIGIALVGLLLVLFAANAYLYHESAGALGGWLSAIIEDAARSGSGNGGGAGSADSGGSR